MSASGLKGFDFEMIRVVNADKVLSQKYYSDVLEPRALSDHVLESHVGTQRMTREYFKAIKVTFGCAAWIPQRLARDRLGRMVVNAMRNLG